jgi:hypothetical protein
VQAGTWTASELSAVPEESDPTFRSFQEGLAHPAEIRVGYGTTPVYVELQPDAFDLVAREAQRRGVSPDQIVEEIVRSDLGRGGAADLDALFDRVTRLWATLPPIDAVALARDGRAEREARGA